MALNTVSSDRLSTNVKNTNFTAAEKQDLTDDILPLAGQLGNRNLVINGAMQVAQRSTSVNKTGANSTYASLDRYRIQIQAGTITESQQDLSSSDTPYSLGFRKFLRVLNQSGIGAGVAQYCQIDQLIEAQDIAQSGWNHTSSSSFLTLTFWVRASVTQAYYARVGTADGTQRHYPYKICDSGGTTLTADTWTKIEVQIPGDSGLTINNDNGVGLFLNFVPYYGTNYTTSSGPTLNGWNTTGSGTNYFPDNTTTWATTTNATFDITGIQLEVGSVATDFEHRSFGKELELCKRYFQVLVDSGNAESFGNATGYDSNTIHFIAPLRPEMRTVPTLDYTNGTDYYGAYQNGTVDYFNEWTIVSNSHTRSVDLKAGGGVSITAAASVLLRTTQAASKIRFDAEL